jgi:Type II secretion system (T2SS), protein M subtype b
MGALMIARLLRLRDDLGPLGFASLSLLVLAGFFYVLVLQPMQGERDRLESMLRRTPGAPAGNLSAFYGVLESKEQTTDSLAKLYAIGTATGVRLQSGNYRLQKAAGRLEHYELSLPVDGSYAQIRDFLQRALTEIPALSLDQLTLRRESRSDGSLHAELRLTLHRVAK